MMNQIPFINLTNIQLKPNSICFFKTLTIEDHMFSVEESRNGVYENVVERVFAFAHVLRFNTLYQKFLSKFSMIIDHLLLQAENANSAILREMQRILDSPKAIQFNLFLTFFSESNNKRGICNLLQELWDAVLSILNEPYPFNKIQLTTLQNLAQFPLYGLIIYENDNSGIYYVYAKPSDDILGNGDLRLPIGSNNGFGGDMESLDQLLS